MNQLKIATRLMLLGGLMTGFLIFIAGLGLYGTGATHNALKTVYENRTIPAGQLGSIDASVLEGRLMIALALANPTPEAIQANTARLEASITRINHTWSAYLATPLTGGGAPGIGQRHTPVGRIGPDFFLTALDPGQ